MSRPPRFSVAIPTYNRRATFLPQAIDGMLHQSFTDFELIVSDNGSSDGTWEYIQSLQDPRIRYIRREPTMPAGEHFAAIARDASGELYILHQDDDVLHRDFLARADAAFNAHPDAGLYSCPIWRQQHGHGYTSRLMRHRAGHDDMAVVCDEMAVFDGPYAAVQLFDPIRQYLPPTMAMRTATLMSIGGFDPHTTYQSDLTTEARLLFRGPLIYDPRPGGVSRVHPGNFMRTKGRDYRKLFFHNSYIELIAAFEQAGQPWQNLLDEYLDRLNEKEVLACLFEWTYYRAPLELQKLGFAALKRSQKSRKRFYKLCLAKLGLRNLARHAYCHWSKAGEISWSLER
ncbi:MAG: glycosyltransferase family A protein [Rhodocyclaceae bacterium]|nr:glycosyltransferase family A protein [Rhodocyclaceae bacterium]MDZ4215935.1 glycosyltransferase family A protein [Rhodocyclaceae bacterium]